MTFAIRPAREEDLPGIVEADIASGRISAANARGFEANIEVNARNRASLALHRKWGFREVARGPGFHTVTFDGGEGVLLTAPRPLA